MFRPLHALILLLFSTGAFAQTTIIYTAQYMGGFHGGGQARPKMQYCTSPHCSDDRGVPIDESTWTAVLR